MSVSNTPKVSIPAVPIYVNLANRAVRANVVDDRVANNQMNVHAPRNPVVARQEEVSQAMQRIEEYNNIIEKRDEHIAECNRLITECNKHIAEYN